MICQNCGKEYDNDIVVCPECGTVINKKLNKKTNSDIIENKSVKYIILSILSIFGCNMISGIVALIFACLGKSDYDCGNYKDAADKWNTTKICLWVGFGIFCVGLIISLIFYGVMIGSMFAIIEDARSYYW